MKGHIISVFLLFSIAFYGYGQVVLPSAEVVEYVYPNFGPYYTPPISVAIDINQLEINDTLVISGSFNDCGEWGGHEEHIFISRKKSKLYCWLKIDSCLCCDKLQKVHFYSPLEKNKPKRNPLTDTIRLHKKDIKLIADYFIYFGHIGEKWDARLTSSRDFSIMKNGKEIYYRKDHMGDWAGFINLKKELFTK